MARIEVPIRAVIENPPAGVTWALQLSKGDLSELMGPTRTEADRLVFDFAIEADRHDDGGLRLLGPGVQGPPDGRFFYLNSGTYAGQEHPTFGRRAKVGLTGLTWALIESLRPGRRLQVRIAGTDKKGGPACATVPLLSPGWQIV